MDEKKYLKRKEKARKDGNREQWAISCNNLGDFYNQEGNYQNAVREYLEEAELYAKLGKELEMAKAHRMVGEMYMLLTNFEEALKHINIYLKIVRELRNKVEEQRAFMTLGRAHLLHGQSNVEISASVTMDQLKLAEKAFLKSLLLIKEISGQITKHEQFDMQARCFLNIGVVKEHMGAFEDCISYIERAIKICQRYDLFELTHLCYISMSLLYHSKKNNCTQALRYCNLALDVAKRLPNKVQKLCETLITKAEILIKSDDFASAKQILTKAYKKNSPNINDRNAIEKMLRIVVKICQTLDELVTTSSVDYGKCKILYEKLGDGCCLLQNYAKALEFYQKMLECAKQNGDDEKMLAPIYVSLYQTYKDNQEPDKALEYLWKEYEINKDVHAEAFSTLCSIGEICELQNQSFWTIQDIYQKAKVHAEKDENVKNAKKSLKIVYNRLWKLHKKHKMNTLLEILEQEAIDRGIDLKDDDEDDEEDSDVESVDAIEHNTPDLGADVCLEDLTDSDTSDLDETEKPRPHRATRGTRCLTIKRNNKGETHLHQACIAGNLELVRRLLDQGHTVNVRDHAGWLPLHEACNHGFRDIVELLLDRGAAVAINDKGGTSCDGITPLYDACINGYLDVVELLIDRGADATVKTDFGENCLQALDKWRKTATLTTGEQAHYHQLRTLILRPLAKVGMLSKTTSATPLTNVTNAAADVGGCSDDDSDSDSDRRQKTESRRDTFAKDSESDGSAVDQCYFSLSGSGKTVKELNQRPSLEYKNVMEQVKHPNRIFEDNNSPYETQSSQSISKQKRTALLDEDEDNIDDTWLIDDVGPEKKKRRFTTPMKELQKLSSHHSSSFGGARKSLSKENLHDSMYSSGFSASTESTSEIEIDSQKEAQKQLLRSNSVLSRQCSSRTASLSLTRRKSKHQASLLESGFCRFRSESPIQSNENDSYSVSILSSAEPDSTTTATATTTSMHVLISPAKASSSSIQVNTQVISTAISFKIKVETELLLVHIERRKLNDINMRWLADEAARRYYNLTGLKPILRLKTSDGFAYEENDPLSVAVEQSMIIATVLEWKIAPLCQRYEEMCQKLKIDAKTDVQRIFERAEASNIVDFEGFWLTHHSAEPIFKALFHQTQLQVLNLSNNFIQNEGCRQLAKAIVTLKQLKILNLRGNFITSSGLEAILLNPQSSKRNESVVQIMEELEDLDISQNPLGNECIRILHKFFNTDSASAPPRKLLQKLSISQCNITNFYDFDLCFFQLISFDVSFNQLHFDSRRKLLSKLNSCRMQCINLNYSCIPTNFERGGGGGIADDDANDIVEFFESGTCEKFKKISLNGCDLRDSHMYRIIQCIKRANTLDMLDVTGNVKLTSNTFQSILAEIPHLRKLIATNCCNFISAELVENLKTIKPLPKLLNLTLNDNHGMDAAADDDVQALKRELCEIWRSNWNEKAQFRIYENNLILYTNDKDLMYIT